MRRELRALTVGLVAAGVVAAGVAGAGVAAAMADDGSGPVATPPASPAVQTVSGVAANGVQLVLTLPKQLPVDLPGQQLAGREVDVTIKDIAGQGYTGSADVTLTGEGAGAGAGTMRTPRVERYDAGSGGWRPVPVGPSAGSSVSVSVSVDVPADGSQQVRLRVSPGSAAMDDVKVSASANGASAVGTVPVTQPTFQAGGLTAVVRAGTPETVTGRLVNATDVAYAHVPVKLYLKACPVPGQTPTPAQTPPQGQASSPGQTPPAPGGKCFGPADVKLEAQVGGAWKQITAQADPTVAGGLSATVFPDVTLPAGGSVQLTARVTVNSGATAVAPVAVGFAPVGLMTADRMGTGTGGTLTVEPVAATPTPTSTPTVSSPSSATTTPTVGDTSATSPSPSASTTSAAAATATPSSDGNGAKVAAGTPGASGSSSDTILVAVGLLAVCLALVLWFVLMKRREAAALAARHDGDE